MDYAVDLIWSIKQQKDKLTRAEQRIAGVLLADIDFAIHASIADLAAKAGVSEPSVTRFCRSMGSKGLKDFKVKLAQSLAVGGTYIRDASPGDHNLTSMSDTVLSLAHDALDRVRTQLDFASLDNAIKLISSARQTHFFGGGGGSTIAAMEGQFRFFRLGVTATAHTEGQLQCMVAATLSAQDVVVAISVTGRSREILSAIEIAQRYEAKVIAITSPDSPLAKNCDCPLLIKIPFAQDLYLPTASRYALLGIIDLLATGVGIRKGPDILEGLRRIQHSLASVRGGDSDQPLGD